jgi:hypothetical protein
MGIQQAVEDRFLYSVKNIQVLSEAELYAGKICAALSRQHPRDLFDIKELLDRTGISDVMRQASVIYLVCSPRPIHEFLKPNLINLRAVYENECEYDRKNISLESLLDARERLIRTINHDLSVSERNFLLSMKQGEPDYSLLPFQNIEQFPALQWKLNNKIFYFYLNFL